MGWKARDNPQQFANASVTLSPSSVIPSKPRTARSRLETVRNITRKLVQGSNEIVLRESSSTVPRSPVFASGWAEAERMRHSAHIFLLAL